MSLNKIKINFTPPSMFKQALKNKQSINKNRLNLTTEADSGP